MHALVTGCSGFIGSHLTEALLVRGWQVTGIDAFTEYYSRASKERNLSEAVQHPHFTLVEADLLACDLNGLLRGVTHVFHLAGEPGVRSCWGQQFRVHTERNLLTTQALLEAAKAIPLRRFLLASSSAVYGLAEALPTSEAVEPRPISPYGVTKHAAEHLVRLYDSQYGVPGTVLRFFTAYGPRQRPDMAFTKFLSALMVGREIPIYGDGRQTRDFTFVSDIVNGSISAAQLEAARGKTINLGRGESVSLLEVVSELERLVGRKASLRFQEVQKGEMAHTAADTSLARRLLGYQAAVGLAEGLDAQVQWFTGSPHLR